MRLLNTLKYIAVLAIATMTMATLASAQPLTIYAGGKGGGYDAVARQVAARLEQRGLEVAVENRNGSDDITLQACRNDNSIWIAQIDALYTREMKDGCALVVIGDYGVEVAAIFFRSGSGLDELSDMTAEHKVFVDKIGSGSELSWRTMTAIEKEFGRGNAWSNAEVVTGDIRRATALANRGKIDALFLVRKPNSADFEKLTGQGWELGELYDRDINDLEYGTTSLYEGTKVRFKANGRSYKDDGYIVRSFIGTTEAVEANNMEVFDAMLGALE